MTELAVATSGLTKRYRGDALAVDSCDPTRSPATAPVRPARRSWPTLMIGATATVTLARCWTLLVLTTWIPAS